MKRLLKIAASIVVCFALIFSVACKGADGAAGNGIKSAVMEDGRLILILDDGSRLDLGSISGDPGAQGEKGDKGDTGAQGEKGDKGDPGAQGEKGDKGDPGAQGEKGDKGDPGAQGEKGDKGDTGAQGEKGDPGAQGEKGDKGDTGAQGEKGDTGAQGEKGEKGDPGAQGEKGDKGDTGAQGEKGDTGAQGEKGDKGDPGAQGEKGDKGDPGVQGEKGDPGAQGEKGDKGDPGAQGEKGDKGDTGDTGKSAYEAFKEMYPEYVGDEQTFIEDLVNGRLGELYIKSGAALLTLTVTDKNGLPVSNAIVCAGEYRYMTNADGEAKIILFKDGASITVEKFGYGNAVLEISAEDINNSEVNMAKNIQLETIKTKSGYIPRSENYMDFVAPNGYNTAEYYYYVTYEETGVRVAVDVIDNDPASFGNCGESDNVEFVIHKKTIDANNSTGNSLRVLAGLWKTQTFIKRATSGSAFGSDEYATLVKNGKVAEWRSERTVAADGYSGMTYEILLDYSLWGAGKAALVGNMTIDAAARNSHAVNGAYSVEASAFRYYSKKGAYWIRASRATLILADGRPTENSFDVPTLTEMFEKSSLGGGKSLMDNLAVVKGTDAKVYRFGEKAFTFSNRVYYVEAGHMPADLEGLAFLYKEMTEKSTEFEVTEKGYVIVAVPAIGYDTTRSALETDGFTRVGEKLPNLVKHAFVTAEPTYYYVKWCEVGEKYSVAKWNIVLFRSNGKFDGKNWMDVAAEVNILSSDELKTKYDPATRQWQGIPGIETVTVNGKTRLWATWFTGKDKEPRAGNFAVYAFSDDGGNTWTEAVTVDFDSTVTDSRVFDPSLFNDGEGNIWLMWNQTNYNDEEISIWYAKVTNPTAALSSLTIEAPVCIGHGLKMNKPTKLKSGEWLYTAHDFNDIGFTKVYSSLDNGKTWNYKGKAAVYSATFANETALAEGKDEQGRDALIMWNRCAANYNIAVSYSYDAGATWTEANEWKLTGPSSRINARTLSSGNVLYVHHYNTLNREKLCVSLSSDGGVTFPHRLIVDNRTGVSYPDIAVADNGDIYVVWDRNRNSTGEILYTKITEQQLLAAGDGDIMDAANIIGISSK